MATGMITRHFDHPSGATATLEMPAGWSRNCWYELRIHNPHAKDSAAIHNNDKKTFPTPEEARQAAVARERLALSNGWKPRMAASNVFGSAARAWTLHRPTGERLDLEIRDITQTAETHGPYNRFDTVTVLDRRIAIIAVRVASSIIELDPGDRFLLRQQDGSAETIAAFIIDRIASDHDSHRATFQIDASITALEPGENEAIEQWHDREAILQAGIETNTSVTELWDWLGTRVTDASERSQVNAAILRGRAERQARLAQQEEFARQREESRQREEARQRATELQVRHPLLLPKQPSENLRVPGVDLSKPKKRKIDLGE